LVRVFRAARLAADQNRHEERSACGTGTVFIRPADYTRERPGTFQCRGAAVDDPGCAAPGALPVSVAGAGWGAACLIGAMAGGA